MSRSQCHASLVPVSTTSLNPILALARAKLLSQAGQSPEAADILVSLLAPEADESALGTWLDRLQDTGSDAVLRETAERLRSRHQGAPAYAALAKRLELLGTAAYEARDHARASCGLECHRALVGSIGKRMNGFCRRSCGALGNSAITTSVGAI